MVDILVYREGHLGVCPVHAGAARIYKVFDIAVPTVFQNVRETHDIAVNVGKWVLERIANTRLRREIDYAPGTMLSEALADRLGIRKVDAVVAISRVRREARKSRLLDSRIVIVIVVVDPDDLVAALK
jgi:hypothetical protein